MKAMILAAGLGTRMLPLTENTPKPLLQAGGRALIEWHLLHLQEAGIEEVVINHHHLGEKLVSALGDGERYGLRIQYSHEPVRLETAGGIIRALPLLEDEVFLVVNGDIWTDFDLSRWVEQGASLLTGQNSPGEGTRLAHLLVVPNPPHNPRGDFHLNEQGLLSASAPDETGVCHTFAGISLLHRELFAGCPEQPTPLAPLLITAMRNNQVSAEYYDGMWEDIGTPERLAALDQRLSAESGRN